MSNNRYTVFDIRANLVSHFQGKLLQIVVVSHVAVDGFTDDLGALFAVFLAPFGIELFFGFECLGLCFRALGQLLMYVQLIRRKNLHGNGL